MKLDSLTLGPPALVNADSSKFLPVAVDLAVVHDDVPPPKVMPGLETASAVALVGPAIEQAPWGGTSIFEPSFVNSAHPMFAIPGKPTEAAEAGETAEVTRPVTAKAVTMVLRISLSPRRRRAAVLAALPGLNIRSPETCVAPGNCDHPFEDRQPPGGWRWAVSCSSPFPQDSG
ncbi:hypothetical protein [Amycolatopsis sp. A133]|uniref:hypothetical protein n=1 Tax=Amycolatopsis sp. A133 TaxID=3064472 RepID=UPI002803F59A|nr:hypothetical protein [Amycolatopsis sp. A133]